MSLLKNTAFFSLAVQIFTGIVDLYVLLMPVASELLLLKQLLLMEFLVQFIEGIFYVWLAFNIATAVNITRKRYYDWSITTPVMLITLSSYLIYLKIKQSGSSAIPDFLDVVQENYVTFFKIIILNAMMLIFGYLGEINVLATRTSVMAGFLPFFAMFYIIYDNYAKYTYSGMLLFSYFFIAWSLYGVSALFNYNWKNVFYNILDLISKNFFGLFLAYVIVTTN
jgi:hypothetical protein|tara:strand:+ start:576 stop:1247 length:672 start_codon:yes stop_codon:yes gene_type:complete